MAASSNGQIPRIDLRIEGMTCASCVARVESALRSVPGVENARVNLATETASVQTATPTDPQSLVRAVQSAGYDAIASVQVGPGSSERRQEQHLRERRQAIVTAIGIGLPIMGLHWFGHQLAGSHEGAMFWPGFLQALLTVMLLISPAGGPIIVSGLRALLHRSANMDLLIALGVLAATVGSVTALFIPRLQDVNYFHDAAMILIFINVGKYLEVRARTRAASSLTALLKRAPRRAMRIDDAGTKEVAVEEVRVGDRLRVAAESYVPVDGRVLSGEASLDMSMWTGESKPIEVQPGGEVFGGVYVYSGAFTMEATAIGADSAIARIARMVEEAQTGKTRMQSLADRVAAIFVPIVVVIAALTAIGWLAFANNGIAAWSAMIAVLVVACPCAMGLATPTAVMVATGSAALRGIIVREPAALESTATCDIALLDKTGTITSGRPAVKSIAAFSLRLDENEVLRMAAGAEQFSPHPLAKAIVAEAKSRGLKLPEPTSYDAHAGLGVKAAFDGHQVLVGSQRFLIQQSVTGLDGEIGYEDTTVLLAVNGQVAGNIALSDTVRPAAADAVRRLKQSGVRPIMVTGDEQKVAATIAHSIGIDEVKAGVDPAGKAECVRQLQDLGHRVMMVGDGINDAPALAAADVGIALTSGTDVAAETASIALAGDRIELVPDAIELARRSIRIIRQNLFWAFAYNVIAIPLAMLLILPAAYAAAAMMFSSISVVLNSLRLQRARVSKTAE